jgi:hypothetical protein
LRSHECVADRKHGGGSLEEFKPGQQAIDDVSWAERPRCIMDEHCFALDRLQAGADRVGAFGTPLDEVSNGKADQRFYGISLLPGSDDHAHVAHGRVADQRLHGPAKHGLASKQAILFW